MGSRSSTSIKPTAAITSSPYIFVVCGVRVHLTLSVPFPQGFQASTTSQPSVSNYLTLTAQAESKPRTLCGPPALTGADRCLSLLTPEASLIVGHDAFSRTFSGRQDRRFFESGRLLPPGRTQTSIPKLLHKASRSSTTLQLYRRG
jgi:hypothetical protein